MKLINYEIYYNFIGKEKPNIINKKRKVLKLICTNRQYEEKIQ